MVTTPVVPSVLKKRENSKFYLLKCVQIVLFCQHTVPDHFTNWLSASLSGISPSLWKSSESILPASHFKPVSEVRIYSSLSSVVDTVISAAMEPLKILDCVLCKLLTITLVKINLKVIKNRWSERNPLYRILLFV